MLLPQADGKPSAMLASTEDGAETLAQSFDRATAKLGAKGAPVVDKVDPERVKRGLDERGPGGRRARSGGEIVVTGHTDTVGATTRNDELSLSRALQVRQLFLARDFPPNRIEAVGRSEREPAVPTADEVAEPRNRRVTIQVR